MKLVIAVIQPDKVDEVREALFSAGITRITVSRVSGHGRQEDEEIYRGQSIAPTLIPKVRLEIACNDEFVEIACKAILKSAKHNSGKIGDGKIFVMPLEQCIRIRTEESGGKAI
ncbi:MAG: P-II family nitrogen regulator [Candidatus Omnitrophica bacterium]|nr:P-II family nitrogen regulator [Candidatus Omnitrophota bacterium]